MKITSKHKLYSKYNLVDVIRKLLYVDTSNQREETYLLKRIEKFIKDAEIKQLSDIRILAFDEYDFYRSTRYHIDDYIRMQIKIDNCGGVNEFEQELNFLRHRTEIPKKDSYMKILCDDKNPRFFVTLDNDWSAGWILQSVSAKF